MAFTVTEIIDANTIRVSPPWKREGVGGGLVRLTNINSQHASNAAVFIISKLKNLLLNKEIELKSPGTPFDYHSEKCVSAIAYLNGIDISVYFPELKTPA